MDPRLTPANSRIAHESLRGQIDAPAYTQGKWRRVAAGVVDILKAPNGPRNRQTLWGERVLELENHDGFAFVQAEKDGYVGYIASACLMDDAQATHWVSSLGTHLYPAPDMKQHEVDTLSFGARLTIVGAVNRFLETDTGQFVPTSHLSPVGARCEDTVANAELFLGTPYLWGGNSRAGIDCSGLVQAALLAVGHDCPGDSDMQEGLGSAIADDTPLERGDLLFWKGHVALVVDQARMIHANAFHMAVAYEEIDAGIARIETQGDGPVTARRRL
ncbi:C40 family peptidase [Aliiroseovarius sp. Z3]|uniref:C40 family peptidase n=1 Tax=Aliiroseovarius sp. Z3 TaxID=2811402 RepID=UPI0023B2D50E|nr:C40 family peptidase [Aliiroseovarius sp. Z3]MDE9449509.1 C40 family peptidase [Aliiroseovarius sp. Z3]